MVSGHSQSLQLNGMGKSLLLIYQQQPRLNYKRRVYSVHTEGNLKYTAWLKEEAVPLDSEDTYYIRPYYQDMEL